MLDVDGLEELRILKGEEKVLFIEFVFYEQGFANYLLIIILFLNNKVVGWSNDVFLKNDHAITHSIGFYLKQRVL